mgnify:CR=1 FL=1
MACAHSCNMPFTTKKRNRGKKDNISAIVEDTKHNAFRWNVPLPATTNYWLLNSCLLRCFLLAYKTHLAFKF